MKLRSSKLRRSEVVALILMLGNMTCPTAFALERGKLEGKQATRGSASRVVGITPAPSESLLGQMRDLDLGTLLIPSVAIDEVMTLVRPEGTYVFKDLARDDADNLSGTVTVYDLNQTVAAEVKISRVAVPNDNRIDFDISVLSAAPDGAPTTLSWVGSVAGINDGTKGVGLAMIAANGGETKPVLLNYGNLDVSSASSLPLLSAIVSSPAGGVATADDPAISDETCEPVSAVAGSVAGLLGVLAVCVLVVVVVVIVVSCVIYCTPRECC